VDRVGGVTCFQDPPPIQFEKETILAKVAMNPSLIYYRLYNILSTPKPLYTTFSGIILIYSLITEDIVIIFFKLFKMF
jgi:hypothetical protein